MAFKKKLLLLGVMVIIAVTLYECRANSGNKPATNAARAPVVATKPIPQTTGRLTCRVMASKGTCWKNFDVTFQVRDVNSDKILATIELNKKTLSKEVDFHCATFENVMMTTQFTPPIWENEKDKSYRSSRIWTVPKIALAPATHTREFWTMPVCFPKDFAGVPTPIFGNVTDCSCPK